MEDATLPTDTVHPEVRAHINSLVSALGGTGEDDDGRYKLGVEALDVLRDLKQWLHFYDVKTNRMDVARCLADCNIIANDLLHIIATWTENETSNRFRSKVALACYELMVPLTWPFEQDRATMTQNHHRHQPVLELAQLNYKRDIVNFDGATILHSAIRAALPAMSSSIGERTPRESGIIKLVLFFIRNIAMIAPPPHISYEGDESLISRSVTVDAFSYQDIFAALLTIASNTGEDFRTEDVIVMEILFHIVKRVDPHKLFMTQQEATKVESNELKSLRMKEKAMLRSQGVKAPTRHSRFGTMIWVKREDGKMSTITGQDALLDPGARKRKMDSTKTFNAPRKAKKKEMEPKDLGRPVILTSSATVQLKSFVAEFLDSGFNPLFQHVRKSLEREAPHTQDSHRRQFFYLVAWFLEAERARQKDDAKTNGRSKPSATGVGAFNLVASVLNQEMFVFVQRTLVKTFTDKEWPELTVAIQCFTQILLTVQEMTLTGVEEDEEIAENIMNRIFYEDETHELVAKIASSYKDQGFEYLDASTELVHNYLRILEGYSKQNVDLMVRSRRRVRRKKKAAATADGGEGDAENAVPDIDDDAAEDQTEAEKVTKERKFDFTRFANRFVPQGVVDTFVEFTKFYRDLNEGQLKRAHRYFYRVAFKLDMGVMLYRVDILHLFYNMIKGPEPLGDRSSGVFKEWEELVKQVVKKCTRKIEERPALLVEMLFSKINATAFYLEYGFEKQTISPRTARPGAELGFRKEVEGGRRGEIGVVVSVLLDKGMGELVDWVKSQLEAGEVERRAWEVMDLARKEEKEKEKTEDAATTSVFGTGDKSTTAGEGGEEETTGADRAAPTTGQNGEFHTSDADAINVKPNSPETKTAMFKNPHLRLLMKLCSFERLAPTLEETPDALWIIPATVDADHLNESLTFIRNVEFSPPTFEEGVTAQDLLKRKSAAGGARKGRKKAEFDDDGDEEDMGDFMEDDLEAMFPAGGPTAREVDEHAKPKNRRRLRQRGDVDGDDEDEEDDEMRKERKRKAAERRRKKKEREVEKARKVKSEMYVRDEDEEWDEEQNASFFRKEEELRGRMGELIRLAGLIARQGGDGEGVRGKLGNSDSEESDGGSSGSVGDSGSDYDVVMTSVQRKGKGKGKEKAKKGNSAKKRKVLSDDEDEEMGGTGTGTGLSESSDDGADIGRSKTRKVSTEPEDDTDKMDVDGDGVAKAAEKGDEDDEDEDVLVAGRRRQRAAAARLGFVDSSDDDD